MRKAATRSFIWLKWIALIENCDVIYSRAVGINWAGGRVFSMRGYGSGSGGSGVIFSNINIADFRLTMQFFGCWRRGTNGVWVVQASSSLVNPSGWIPIDTNVAPFAPTRWQAIRNASIT